MNYPGGNLCELVKLLSLTVPVRFLKSPTSRWNKNRSSPTLYLPLSKIKYPQFSNNQQGTKQAYNGKPKCESKWTCQMSSSFKSWNKTILIRKFIGFDWLTMFVRSPLVMMCFYILLGVYGTRCVVTHSDISHGNFIYQRSKEYILQVIFWD